MEAVSDWLEYFGMGRLLSAFNGGQPGFGFLLKIPGARRPLDPESVGVGVSQVLPILIMCLAAPEGMTMIIEQPELHLHPQAQSRLGDFFLSMSLLGKQCILETHSEHMLERINYRAAASYGRLQPLVKCYFVEACEGRGDVSDKMGKGKSIYGGSTVREVPLNNYQAIVRWPEGFYDEGQRREEMIVRIAREAWDYPNLVDAAGENN
jgi:predicted ATPase